ncbi:hypothetical protein FKM82_008362 [Ascaphus truei]
MAAALGEGPSRARCGCQGIRRCLLCEPPGGGGRAGPPGVSSKTKSFIYSPTEGLAMGIKNTDMSGWAFPFPGVCLIQDFVTEDEEREMVHLMDEEIWRPSQSGRRKQDYGPKVNFKKQKLTVGNFTGLPKFSRVLWHRMKLHAILEGFMPVEQCNLDYSSDRGSAIDPHFDDSWLWGEHLVSLNLLSKTVLTMTNESVNSVQLKSILDQRIDSNGVINSHLNHDYCAKNAQYTKDYTMDDKSRTKLVPYREVEVAICLPPRSLVILSGDARYMWKHAIHREHIEHRRVCITFRELSAEFSLGGKEEELGQMLLQKALGFQGKSI